MSAQPLQSKPVSIPVRDLKVLWGRASARCAFPKCARKLVGDRTATDREVVFGEAAHIVAEQPRGPRGDSNLSGAERNCYDNLILLCEEHHKLVDGRPGTYTVAVLRQFKLDHELECERRQDREPNERTFEAHDSLQEDRLHATLMPVRSLPRTVYAAVTDVTNPEELKRAHEALHDGRRPPVFILRAHRLWAFDDLRRKESAFAPWVDGSDCLVKPLHQMEADPDLLPYYMALLNRVLHKIAGARGLTYDKNHDRWHFAAPDGGLDRLEKYVPPNQAISSRRVAWRPVRKKSGERKNYWEHLALEMRFLRAASDSWFLALRPERHFTRDGHKPLPTKGRRASSRAAHLYNWQLLQDAHFWRGYLANHEPRIIKEFGPQSLIIEAQLAQATVSWPGVPNDRKDFANAVPEEDLFSQAALSEALGPRQRDDFEDEGDDDLPELDA